MDDDVIAEVGAPWTGVLAPEGVVSGDGRKFKPGSLRWRDLPLPLSWQKANAMGHDGSVVVGRIDTIDRDEAGLIRATGVFDTSDDAIEAHRQVENKMIRGVSVDVDDATVEFETPEGQPLDGDMLGLLLDPEDEMPVQVLTDGRICGSTLCAIPAFQEAFVSLADAPPAPPPPADEADDDLDAQADALVAEANQPDADPAKIADKADALLAKYEAAGEDPPDALLKLAGLEAPTMDADGNPFTADTGTYTGDAVRFETVSDEDWEGGAENFTRSEWIAATLIHLLPGPGQDPDAKALHKIPVRNAGGVLNRNAVHAAASILAGARGGVKAPEKDKTEAAQVVVRLYRDELGEEPPKSVVRLSGGKVAEENAGTMAEFVDEKPWGDYPESAYDNDQWHRACLIHVHDGKPTNKAECKLPVKTPSGAVNRNGVHAAASRIGSTQAPSDQIKKAAKALVGLYQRELKETPPDGLKKRAESSVAEVLVASGMDDFLPPLMDGPTPLTVTPDGRVYGHLAEWGTCHIGKPPCVTPPHSATGYALFHLGEHLTADGSSVPIGQITLGTGHAGPQMNAQQAMEHYDNTGTAVADICVGEDDYGIWCSGLLRPKVTEEQKAELRAAKLSGDWRRWGGNLELVAALAVNVPGFPIPRIAAATSRDRQTSLVASGVVSEPVTSSDTVREAVHATLSTIGRQRRAERIAASIGRDRNSRARAALTLIRGGQ